ncbi:hypothetical protein Lal_00042295 [Lupinus albus]|nr:hypothetical protein Lal_00042295 [Lupinus albus]
MASESFVQPTISGFDGHYDHWSMLMENFMRSKEYWAKHYQSVRTMKGPIINEDPNPIKCIIQLEEPPDRGHGFRKT